MEEGMGRMIFLHTLFYFRKKNKREIDKIYDDLRYIDKTLLEMSCLFTNLIFFNLYHYYDSIC